MVMSLAYAINLELIKLVMIKARKSFDFYNNVK